MSEEFDRENRSLWEGAITRTLGNAPPRSGQWSDRHSIIQVLTPFMENNLNHTMYPGGGGMDIHRVAQSFESGCLELSSGSRVGKVFQPGDLHFEHFPESPWNSFFLLETRPLAPCGVYPDNHGESEEVVELSPGEYIGRHHYDDGVLGYDEAGIAIPLPADARVVIRYIQGTGKFLVVAKRSYWNLQTQTYDGRHNNMTAQEIRGYVQAFINRA